MPTPLTRLFQLVDDPPAAPLPGLRAYEFCLASVIGVEYWLRAVPKWGQLGAHYYVLLAVATLVCPVAATRRGRRLGFAALAVGHAGLIASEFPSAGNHAYLECLLCALASFVDLTIPAEARLYVRAVRWIAAVVIGASGLQKLAHGHYRHAEYLAFSLGSETFRPVLRPLLGTDEFARLVALTGAVGDGPYRVESWPLVATANFTWLLELALAPLLCWSATRPIAVAVAMALLFGIELAAREVFFGLVFANTILLFAPARAHRAFLPVAGGLLATLTLSRLGLVPAITFY
jgi:hypothetical protein